MKVTDYCPRAAPFDSHLKGRRDLIGAEIGVDVGAHAEALLRYWDVRHLTLVDPWPNPFCRGYCEARMRILRWWPRVTMVQEKSHQAATSVPLESLDFVYIDQEHTFDAVSGDLAGWWPRLKPGGVLGYRNYAESEKDLVRAVDAFVAKNRIKTTTETGEIVLWK